jgi:hypothetical protein
MTFSKHNPNVCLEGMRKTTKISARISGNETGIRTRIPPNTKHEWITILSGRSFRFPRVYPKVSGLSHNEINTNNKLVEKQHKVLWRQNSLD